MTDTPRKRDILPNYKFECSDCRSEFYDLCSFDVSGEYPDVTCPNCGSTKKEKMLTSCSFQFSNPVDTDKWNSESTGHDYRFKHNIPKVQKERAVAEAMSHMGSNPYGNNLGNDIDLDTGIHDADSRHGLS